MKKLTFQYIKYFIAFTLLFNVGCSDFLKENPKTFINPDALFLNANGYDQAVIGIYSNLQNMYSVNSLMLLEMCTDSYSTPSSSIEQALPTYLNSPAAYFYNTRTAWSSAYTLIKDANFAIQNLESSTIANKNQLLGEAKFLRGFAYFYLVQLYGDVPVTLTTLASFKDTQLSRQSQDKVYTQILEDLNFAEANLATTSSMAGRVNKFVATGLLARVYLTMAGNPMNKTENYKNALTKALAVINSNIYMLNDSYDKVFHNTMYTKESLWEQTYITNSGGNPMHGITSTAKSFKPMFLPSTKYTNSFSKGDTRQSWGILSNYKDSNGDILDPFFHKFIDTKYIDQGLTASSNALIANYTYPFMRLAEMYLIAAEAENEVNGPANAYIYVNAIRKRARINSSDPSNVPDLVNLTKENLRNAIWTERKLELHLEGFAWLDMKRTNTFANVQNLRGTSLINPIGAYNQTWLLPDNEVINNDIPQNPLYGK